MMKVCPKCKKECERLLSLSRVDNKTMICDECGIKEALEAADIEGEKAAKILSSARRMSHYERTKAAVYATGNKWAIENFHATHD